MNISAVSSQASQMASLLSLQSTSNVSTTITATDPAALTAQASQLTGQNYTIAR